MIGLIWAQTTSGVIGDSGTIPWHLPEDLRHFKQATAGHPVIMGRNTWESLPAKHRPLPGRINIVITTRADWTSEGAVRTGSLTSALTLAAAASEMQCWIIGGGQIYREALHHADTALITMVDLDIEGDTHAPTLGPEWRLAASTPETGWQTSSGGIRHRMETWTVHGSTSRNGICSDSREVLNRLSADAVPNPDRNEGE